MLDSARILTGYHVETWQPAKKTYNPADHYTGPVQVLGWKATNANGEGRPELIVLPALPREAPGDGQAAGHPALPAVRLRPARRRSIVAAVAKAYLKSGTSIKATLRALVKHPDFAKSAGAKVRTPSQDAIATYRAMGLKVSKPNEGGDFGFAVNYVLDEMGESPFMWPAPNGFPEPGAAWASAGRMRSSWGMHHTTAGGWWPSRGNDPQGRRATTCRRDRCASTRRSTACPARCSVRQGRARTWSRPPAHPGPVPAHSDDQEPRGLRRLAGRPLIATVLNSPQHLRK